MRGLSFAVCDRALPPAGPVPDWVHLLRSDRKTARDGRTFELADPAALILDFQSGCVDLPVDFEHANDNPDAKARGPVPATGWIKELAANPSGLWGGIEGAATAREMIGRREDKYLAPSILYNAARQIRRLKGAGLVHNPALSLTALASQEFPMRPETDPAKTKPDAAMMSPMIKRLIAFLGLPPDASGAEIDMALEKWLDANEGAADKADPGKFVPIEAVMDMLQERNIQTAVMTEASAAERVSSALRAISDALPKRIPLGKAWPAAVLDWRGYSATEIARTLRTTDLSVRKMLKARRG